MVTSKSVAYSLLREAEQAAEQYTWEGPFAEYLRMVIENPSVSRLSHKIAYDAILDQGVHESATGDPVYGLFEDKIFGLDTTLDKIVQYFYSASRRLEIRKRILLLMGPPAGGKSSIAALIKQALERHTRTDKGAVYAIKGCPMQEEPPSPDTGKHQAEAVERARDLYRGASCALDADTCSMLSTSATPPTCPSCGSSTPSQKRWASATTSRLIPTPPGQPC